ncbi:MAG TPA: MFS transporter [Candidatus Cloacimonadota bacterium]|nr:MFS transporter [Candidatus Cloacimonadota bacterium]HPT70809.1 MFS transporter [Candidatus Cloacimonadota bacterium]
MKLSKIEKRTFLLLMISTFFNAMIGSLSNIQDIISKKALHALDWQLTLLAMVWPLSNFISIWWGKVLEHSKHKARYFLLVAILGRLVLIFGMWVVNMNQFLILLTFMFSFSSLLIPATNAIYQENISPMNRGRIFGYTVSLTTLAAMVISFFAGRLLDQNEHSFHMILMAAGISGFLSAFVLSLVKFDKNYQRPQLDSMTPREILYTPIKRMMEILKTNKEFAKFERNFSAYGMGFIMLQPVIPIYLVQNLQLNYTYNFLGKGILSQYGFLILSPIIGKLHDKFHPHKFTAISFGALTTYPLMFLLSYFVHDRFWAILLVYIAFVLFGVAMTGVNISWNMGTIFFAGKGESPMYQSVHVTMTGLRGVVAPLLGLFLLRTCGIASVFLVATLFLILASWLSRRDYKNFQCKSEVECVPENLNLLNPNG